MKSVRILAPLLAVALASCGESGSPEGGADTAQPGEVDAKPGLSASKGVLMLPVVAGNPGAAYFELANTGETDATLAGVYVDGAETSEMHQTEGGSMSPVETVDVPAGGTVEFARGGLHVMAFGLPETLKPGDSVEMTLTFSDGDKLSIPLELQGVTGDAGGMGGMDHGDSH